MFISQHTIQDFKFASMLQLLVKKYIKVYCKYINTPYATSMNSDYTKIRGISSVD